jgi:hypothetical protein
LAIQSERDDWKGRANFAREMFQRFKEKSENQVIDYMTCSATIEKIMNFMITFTSCQFLVVCVEK